jgi:AcrR family transcriptional regulator
MLHYYFRTKEKLFQKIFKAKVQMLTQMFSGIIEQNKPFTETVRLIVEMQFNFVAQNQQLPRFIFNEILLNKKNRDWAIETLSPNIAPILNTVETLLNNEIAKGNIRPITIRDFMLNVISMNISMFIAMPILKEIFQINNDVLLKNQINERRENNVQFILNALKP